jgi:hypothetical protein
VAEVEAATEDSGVEELAGTDPKAAAAGVDPREVSALGVDAEVEFRNAEEDEISRTGVDRGDSSEEVEVATYSWTQVVSTAVLETTDAGGKGIGTDVSRGWVLVYEGLDESEAEPKTKAAEGDPVVAAGVSVSTMVEFGEESTGLAVPDETGATTFL